MDRRTFLKGAGVGVAAFATGFNTLPAWAKGSKFVRRSGNMLTFRGHPWYLYGGSTYGTTNPGGQGTIAGTIDLAQQAGLNALRLVNFLDERGLDPNAPFDPGAWTRVDQTLAAMSTAGLKAILDLSTYRNHLQNLSLQAGSGVTPYQRNWKPFLKFVANRVNTANGLRYKNDPTIAMVSFAGEPNPPNSEEPLKPTTQELTDFYRRVFAEWKGFDKNHLVSSGGLLHIDWEEIYGNPDGSGIDYVAIFSLPKHDVPSIHNYWNAFPPSAATDFKTPKIATVCASIGRPWITEEFGFLQAPVDTETSTAYDEADRGAWYDIVYAIQADPSPTGVPAAGVAFWNLGNEVDPASHDVNPSTPTTWGSVKSHAP